MKRSCVKCGISKEPDGFAWRSKRNNERHARCKECYREAMKDHYRDNKDQYIKKNKEAKHRKTEFLIKLREETPCNDCGNKFPYYVMEFDHLKHKKEDVTTLVGSSWKKLLTEIKKCDLVCANCHRVRTHRRRKAQVDQLAGVVTFRT